MIIDFSSHIIPPDVGKILAKKPYYGPLSKNSNRYYFPYPPNNADPKVRLSVMDKYGVHMQLLSQTTPVLLGFNAREAAIICRLSNDYIGELCSKYPERFVGCAIVSLLDVDAALEELDRVVGELGLKCVTVSTNQNGKGLDSLEYFPFYERVSKYNMPIFLHPTNWADYPLVSLDKGWMALNIFGWPFDTTQAVWRLIFGGVLEKYPNLKIVTHHLGGMLPYYSCRIIGCSHIPRIGEKLQKPFESYLKQFYGDTALNGGPFESYMCGYVFFGSERMLFGTDYPFGHESVTYKKNIACIKSMPISHEEKDKILYVNAKNLLKI